MLIKRLLSCISIGSLAASASCQSFDFVGPDGPGVYFSKVVGLSADGHVAAGLAGVAAAFTWTKAGGRYNLYSSDPGMPLDAPVYGLSGNGSVLVGSSVADSSTHAYAYRWSGPGTFQSLGTISGWYNSYANASSNDGSVIAGDVEDRLGNVKQACRWTASGGIQGLGWTRPDGYRSEAKGVSRDGGTIVGYSFGGNGAADAFAWTESGGMRILAPLPGARGSSEAHAVNSNGSIVVGDSGDYATIWRDGVASSLGISDGWFYSSAKAVNEDGTVVVGSELAFDQIACIWTPARGIEPLADYLSLFSISVPSGWTLWEASSVSADGKTIGGFARDASGARQGFVVTVPSPGVLPIMAAGALLSRRRRSM